MALKCTRVVRWVVCSIPHTQTTWASMLTASKSYSSQTTRSCWYLAKGNSWPVWSRHWNALLFNFQTGSTKTASRSNASKTHMIVFGTKAMLKNQPKISIKFCGTDVQESRVVKNMGLYMDRHLTFADHVDHVVAKCSGSLLALMHAKHTLPKASIKTIVTALVMSIIRYCVSIYGTCTKAELHRIQKVINFGARVISGKKKFDHISDVLKDLGWLSSSQLAEHHRAQMVRRVLSSELPETFTHKNLAHALVVNSCPTG